MGTIYGFAVNRCFRVTEADRSSSDNKHFNVGQQLKILDIYFWHVNKCASVENEYTVDFCMSSSQWPIVGDFPTWQHFPFKTPFGHYLYSAIVLWETTETVSFSEQKRVELHGATKWEAKQVMHIPRLVNLSPIIQSRGSRRLILNPQSGCNGVWEEGCIGSKNRGTWYPNGQH